MAENSTRRELNVKLFAVLVVVGILGWLAWTLLHTYQLKSSARLMLERGDEALAEGNLETAIRSYKYYVANEPEDAEAFCKLALLLAEQAQTQRAVLREAHAHLEQAVGRDPTNLEVLRRAADVALEANHYQAAARHFSHLLEMVPEEPQAHFKLGRCLAAVGDPKRAVEALQIAIVRDPKNVQAYSELAGVFRMRLGEPERADAVLEQMVKANPQSGRAHIERARSRFTAGDLARAKPDVEQALALDGQDLEVLLGAADYYGRAREYGRAQPLLEQAKEAAPQDERVDRALIGLRIGAGDQPGAIALLQAQLDRNPDDFRSLTNLMDLQLRSNDIAAANATLERLRSGRTAKVIGDFFQARIHIAQEKWREASEELEAVREKLRTNPLRIVDIGRQTELSLGLCYEHLGLPDRMLDAFERAMQIDPTSVQARLGYATALYHLRRLDRALDEYLKIYRALGPDVFAKDAGLRATLFQLLAMVISATPAEQRNWNELEELLAKYEQVGSADAVELGLFRVDLRLRQNRAADAKALVEKLQKQFPDDARVRRALAMLAASQSPEKLADALQGESVEDSVEVRLMRASVAPRLGPARGLPLLRRLEQNAERFPEADRLRLWQGLGQAYYQLRDREQTKRFWRRVLEARPDDRQIRMMAFEAARESNDEPWMLESLAGFEKYLGRQSAEWRFCQASYLVWQVPRRQIDRQMLAMARGYLKQVAHARPRWQQVPLLEAEIAVMEGRLDDAILEYRHAAALRDLPARQQGQYARLLYVRGRYEEAREQVTRLAVIDGSPAVKMLSSELEMRSGNVRNSLELAAAIVADSKNPIDFLWYGQFLSRAGRTDEAELAYRRAVGLGRSIPGDVPEAWLALIGQLVANGKKQEAEATLRLAQVFLPEDRSATVLARAYEVLGQQWRAEETYVAAAQLNPTNINVIREAAAFFAKLNRMGEARGYLARLLALDTQSSKDRPVMTWARRLLATMVASTGGYLQQEQAMALLNENALDGRTSLEDLLLKAAILAARPGRGAHLRAIEMLEQVRRDLGRLYPQDRRLLAQLYEKVGRWQDCRDLHRSLVDEFPNEANYLAGLTRVVLKYDAPEVAEPLLKRLKEMAPKDPQTIELDARYLARNHAPEKAEELLLSRITRPITPEQAATVTEVVGILESLERYKAAQQLLVELADVAPPQRLALAAFYSRRAKLSEALAQCETALKSMPPAAVLPVAVEALREAGDKARPEDMQRVHRWFDLATGAPHVAQDCLLPLAALYDLQGKYQESVEVYREFLGRGSVPSRDRAVVANNLAYLLAVLKQEPALALALIEDAIKALGASPELRDTHGLALMANNRGRDAVEELTQVVGADPKGINYFHLALASAAAGDMDGARRALETAQKQYALQSRDIPPVERPHYEKLLETLRSQEKAQEAAAAKAA